MLSDLSIAFKYSFCSNQKQKGFFLPKNSLARFVHRSHIQGRINGLSDSMSPFWLKSEGFTCLLPAFSALQMVLRASFRTDILTIFELGWKRLAILFDMATLTLSTKLINNNF